MTRGEKHPREDRDFLLPVLRAAMDTWHRPQVRLQVTIQSWRARSTKSAWVKIAPDDEPGLHFKEHSHHLDALQVTRIPRLLSHPDLESMTVQQMRWMWSGLKDGSGLGAGCDEAEVLRKP
jgi:hypothetical protein